MKELHKILTENISYDGSIVVTVDTDISKVTIRIFQSVTMILFGFGKENKPGFTLYLSVEKRSNKGKRIIEELTKDNFLDEFKTLEEKRSMTYAFDFKTDIDSIVNKTYEILVRLKIPSPDNDTRLNVSKTNEMHYLE